MYNSSYPHFWVHYQTNPAKQHFYPPSPYKIYCPHSKDAQASRHCRQAFGKHLLTFPARSTFLWMSVSTNRFRQHLMLVLSQHQAVTHRNMSQPRNPSWLYFPKLPYILQAYRHTCLQRNEAGERVSSRMVGIGKSVLFSTSTSKAFWMESNNCSMSLLVSTASLLLFSFGCFSALC